MLINHLNIIIYPIFCIYNLFIKIDLCNDNIILSVSNTLFYIRDSVYLLFNGFCKDIFTITKDDKVFNSTCNM